MQVMVSAATRPSGLLLWGLTGLALAINLAVGLLADDFPPLLLATGITLSLVLFAFVHGSATYGLRAMAVFAVLCIVVGNLVEYVAIATGIFGSYRYTEMLGPKFFLVPALMGPAYFGMGYLAWMLALIVLESPAREHPVHRTFTVPAIAAVFLAAWNVSYEPLASTGRQAWIWLEGGAYFGVPVTNSLLWWITGYLFFQLFALYLWQSQIGHAENLPRSKSYWLQPIGLYGTVPIVILLAALTVSTTDSVTDQAGVAWRVRDMYAVSALLSFFTMGVFSMLGLIRLAEWPKATA